MPMPVNRQQDDLDNLLQLSLLMMLVPLHPTLLIVRGCIVVEDVMDTYQFVIIGYMGLLVSVI